MVTFYFQSGETKSITINHTRTSRRNFSACGVQNHYTDLELAATDFDTVGIEKEIKIPVADLQSIPTKNIEIIQR